MLSGRKKFLAPAAIVLALTLAPMLTACGGNPIQGLVDSATGGKVNLGGTQVPADFPKEVPLASGSVLFGASIGDGDGKIWNVSIKVDDASAMDGIKAQLEGAGFTSVSDGTSSLEAQSGLFTKDPYGVLVVLAPNEKDGGFVANYTVSYSKDGS